MMSTSTSTVFSYFKASAVPTISINSRVIEAWRARFICNVNEPIIFAALLVAESMAVMRAPCSLAVASNSARCTATSVIRGKRLARSCCTPGSYKIFRLLLRFGFAGFRQCDGQKFFQGRHLRQRRTKPAVENIDRVGFAVDKPRDQFLRDFRRPIRPAAL